MSGEAAWLVASKLFSLALLSGQPVWSPAEAVRVEANLKARYQPLIPAVEKAVLASQNELAIAPFDPNASDREVPSLAALVIEDLVPGAPDQDPHYFKPGEQLRARVTLSVRDKPSGAGFNLVLHVTARPRRSQLDALARAVARILYPATPPEQLKLR